MNETNVKEFVYTVQKVGEKLSALKETKPVTIVLRAIDATVHEQIVKAKFFEATVSKIVDVVYLNKIEIENVSSKRTSIS